MSILYGLDKKEVFDGLMKRERLGSTYMGNGVAIPHCRLAGLDSPKVIYIRLNGELDTGSKDERVRSFFFLFASESSPEDHLTILAQVASLVSDEAELKKLREASTSENFCLTLEQWCASQPAE